MHTVPANKIPFGKFRDKSIPVDNVSTLDTTTDLILYAEAMRDMTGETAEVLRTKQQAVKMFMLS